MSDSPLIPVYSAGKGLAENYYNYRPTYPPKVAETIIAHLRSLQSNGNLPEKFQRMVDVGCGTGQSTRIFAPYFDSIIGIDISAPQLEVAREKNKCANISFQLMKDNSFPIEDNSVDLVTAATAAHWFDIVHFMKECQRVLKPHGCAVVYTYLEVSLKKHPFTPAPNQDELDIEFQDMNYKFIMEDIKGHPRNVHVAKAYTTLYDQIPSPSKGWIRGMQFDMDWTLADWRRFWTSKGEYYTMMHEGKPEIDPLDTYIEKTKRFLNVDEQNEADVKIKLTLDVPAIVFRK